MNESDNNLENNQLAQVSEDHALITLYTRIVLTSQGTVEDS